jgi:hypothetical protein
VSDTNWLVPREEVRSEKQVTRPRAVQEPRGRGTLATGSRYQATGIEYCEDIMCAVVTGNFGVCNSVGVPQLFVLTFCKCSINLSTNPNTVYSHSTTWQYIPIVIFIDNRWQAKCSELNDSKHSMNLIYVLHECNLIPKCLNPATFTTDLTAAFIL